MSKKVLVIGGCGFIGSNLSRYFSKKGYDVSVFDKFAPEESRGIKVYCGDAYDSRDLDEIILNFDIVINAVSLISPSNQFEAYREGYAKDIDLNLRLTNILKDVPVKYLFISSAGAIYGDAEAASLSERTCVRPINYYGSLKLCVESICHVMNNIAKKNKFISLRIANAFGPNQNYKKGVGFIDAVLKCALTKETLTIFGDGETVRDYVYIDDICNAVEKIADYEGEEEIFNISSGIGYSQNQIIAAVEKKGYEIKRKFVAPRVGDVESVVVDNGLIKSVFDFTAMDLDRAIELFLSHIKEECK